MVSFTGLALGLSLVFGFLLLALIAELYYLLCWRKKINNNNNNNNNKNDGFLQFIWWKRVAKFDTNKSQDVLRDGDVTVVVQEQPDPSFDSKDVVLRACSSEESAESELMRLHNLSGPPRFLSTIKEETKEDLESDDAKSKGSRTRSLSDLTISIDTPLVSPLAPLPDESFKFNPLFGTSSDGDSIRVFQSPLSSSPPPKFKFLRDAEEKLLRRLREEAKKMANVSSSVFQCPSSSSQVLPLASSPTSYESGHKESSVH